MKLRYGTPEEAGMDPQRIEHIKDLARGWVAEGVTPSLVVLAARRGIIVLHEAYGVMGPEPDAGPLQKDTIFPLASLSKPITATAAMCLVEDGLLGLNRPVQWYIPEFVGEGKEQVCVHHLLTHTSGLRDEDVVACVERKWGTVAIPPAEPTQHPRMHERLCLSHDTPLWKAPGAEMSYCTWNYEWLGEIVRRVSGQSLADFTRERIFQPLGMADSAWAISDAMRPRLVRRAADAPGAADFAEWGIGQVPWASAGAHATALDMAIFGQMFLNRGAYAQSRVLSPASVAAMTRNQIPGVSSLFFGEFFAEASWGLGWDIHGPKKCIGHGEALSSDATFSCGGMGGTCLWMDPACELVGVYFSVRLEQGLPPGVSSYWARMNNHKDLFVNAVTAAVVE